MNRKEFYYIDDKEVSRDEWFKKFNSDYNLSTLTIKYRDISTKALLKEIEELKEKVNELEQKNKVINNNSWHLQPLTTQVTYESNS